ncbi:fumarate reductase flavoprotein subunit [Lachnospiraceae bacterium KM106-2]|nr:fumarate reductase flavoprotein subunit [Lachnospiraceae bacterium KM106-2]
MKKKLSLIMVGVLMTSMLTACGSSDSTKKNDASTQKVESTTETKQDKKADIVVIGAGGAGMTAAIQAAQDGATNVVIVEKMPITGGNTTRATGGLNAAETKYQEKQKIKDSVELFVKDTMEGGKNLNDKDLVTTLAKNSASAVDWVNEIGGDLGVVAMFGGASVERIHRPSDTSAVGPMLVTTLNNKIEELNIPVLLETEAKKIIVDESGKVTGVKVSDKDGEFTIDCKGVIVATGGFAANSEMVVKNNADYEGFGNTNHAGATGDGIVMATEVGAATVDMDQIQNHPTVDPETQTLYTEGVRGNGAILVNLDGKRFINELETRDVVSAAILEQKDAYCYMLFDQEVRESLSAIEKYISSGLVVEADSIEELAGKIGVNKENLVTTMKNYANYAKSGKDADFGRESMALPLTGSKYYAMKCAPAIHHTMGGLKINTSAEVLNADGKAISGLFAAGEVTGGVHGANRLGGNAVADIVVFGRIAGTSANKYVAANGGNTEATIKVAKKEEAATPEVDGNFKDGTYTGTGKGNGGDIKVEVTVKDGNVVKVELTDHHETPGIYENAESGVVNAIIRTQSTEVDTVTGATNSSNGIKEAVANALKEAK